MEEVEQIQVTLSEETKLYIRQFARDSKEILSYTEQQLFPCYKHLKTGEIVLKSEAVEYALNKFGIDIKVLNTDEQDEFMNYWIDDIQEYYFSGNWYETVVKERDL